MSTNFPPTPEPHPHGPLEEGTGEGETAWYGISYDCLVHLASPLNDSFTPFSPVYRGHGAGADADVATLYSAASLMSVSARPPMLHTPLRGIFPSPPSPAQSPSTLGRPASPAHSDFSPSIGGLGTGGPGSGNAGGAATGLGKHRTEFESREVVAEAQPFSPTPDFVLVGAPGLVRAALLSNRVHALTVDTAGVVAVWDIIRAVCVGQFMHEDVVAASTNGSHRAHEDCVCSPREALDIVRGRIDGEAVVVTWSAVDTSTGVLNVHLDEHVFDAELYADELGCTLDRPLPSVASPEDMRSAFPFPLALSVELLTALGMYPQLIWASGSSETFSKGSSVRNNMPMLGACVLVVCRRREGSATFRRRLRLPRNDNQLTMQNEMQMPLVPAPWSSLRLTYFPHYRRTAWWDSA